jgi:hypothetical protein
MSFDFEKIIQNTSDDVRREVKIEAVFDNLAKAEEVLRLNVAVLTMIHGWPQLSVIMALLRIAIEMTLGDAKKHGSTDAKAFEWLREVIDGTEKSLSK